MNPLYDEICALIASQVGTDIAVLTAESSLRDLGVDSLDAAEVCMQLENHFGMRIFEPTLTRDIRIGEVVEMTARALERQRVVRTVQDYVTS
jgi:acyl carrier protein